MNEQAEQFAELKGSKLLRFRKEDDLNIILLDDGRKFKFTDTELENELSDLKIAHATENPETALKTIAKIRKGKS